MMNKCKHENTDTYNLDKGPTRYFCTDCHLALSKYEYQASWQKVYIKQLESEHKELNKEVAKQRRTIENFGLSKYVDIEQELKEAREQSEHYKTEINKIWKQKQTLDCEIKSLKQERSLFISIVFKPGNKSVPNFDTEEECLAWLDHFTPQQEAE